MSKPNPNYKGSAWDKFTRWAKGTYDPADGKLESTPPKDRLSPGERAERMLREYDQSRFEEGVAKEIGAFQIISRIFFVLMAVFMVVVLLYTVSFLPAFGDTNAPVNNEVSQRYIEQGLEETGAVNIVAGMILDYRAFDTFGESCVLFVALCCVTILLRADKKNEIRLRAREERETLEYEPQEDNILQQAARILVPLIIIFGIYVVLNGHISPGGGFSGGAIIGTGLILYLTAFGVKRTRRFMNERVIKTLTVCALTFYCFAKSYSFYTGANGLESIITTGTPGAILSAGLIVYLNICVGIVVACTMYSFYILFRRGQSDMLGNLLTNYEDVAAVILFVIGMGNLLLQSNLVKKIIGLDIMDSAVYLFLASKGYIEGGASPIYVDGIMDASYYINPIPAGLVLTGIVVSVSVSALMMALTICLYREYHTLNLDEIMLKLGKEEM